MSSAKLTPIDIGRIDSIKTLMHQLRKLNKQLVDSDHPELITFNGAYEIVTRAIQTALQRDYFENPKFIEQFSVCFGHYYFQAINDALSGKQDTARAWSNLLQASTHKPLPNFIYLLMGANAHINHDLSLAMYTMLRKDNTDNLLQDIIKVDTLLMAASKDIVRSFSEPNTIPRIIKERCRYLYLKPIMYLILYWRFKAWRDYRRMYSNGVDGNRYMVKGKNASLGLMYLGRLLT